VRKAAELLKDRGYVRIEKRQTGNITSITAEGENFLASGFPEERILKKLKAKGTLPIASLEADERSIGLGWARKQNAIRIGSGTIAIINDSLPQTESQRKMLEWVKAHGGFVSSVVHPSVKELISRGLITNLKPKKDHLISLTPQGSRVLEGGAELRTSYNLTAPVERQYPSKLHPIQRTIDRMRRIFFEMGFEEMEGPAVESAFWNFDALFQPQDHPARDLADTFYVKGRAGRKCLLLK